MVSGLNLNLRHLPTKNASISENILLLSIVEWMLSIEYYLHVIAVIEIGSVNATKVISKSTQDLREELIDEWRLSFLS